MNKFFIFIIATMLSINVLAISIPITEEVVNDKIREKFPKTVKKIEFSNPYIVFLENKSVLCMDGIPRIIFLNKPFKFCATFKPVWNEKEARLEATHLELNDFDIEGVGSISDTQKLILNEVIINLEPIVLYKSDSWFIKQISSIEVQKGTMYLKF